MFSCRYISAAALLSPPTHSHTHCPPLPTASDPVRAMLSFRDHKTSVLLCSPHSARGLDLPAVTHVFNIGPPEDTAQ